MSYRLTYLGVPKKEQRYNSCFEGQRAAWKVNVTFLAVINKEIRCPFVHLACKPQQDNYCWCIFKLKCQKMVETAYSGTSKEQTRYFWCFQVLKSLRKGNNGVFALCQQTRKVECKYLLLLLLLSLLFCTRKFVFSKPYLEC